MDIKLIEFKINGDERGSLVSLESQKNIPFVIKRVYYLFDTQDGVRRGFHAHKKLKQILICVAGSCDVLLDNGKEKMVVNLSNPNTGLLVESMIWHEMFNFSHDCVLMVLADDYYDEADYIRSYDEFVVKVEDNTR